MSTLRTFLLIAYMIFLSMIAMAHTAPKQPIICNNTYALCNAASCQPIPGLQAKVLCHCSIWQGKNIGFSECSARKEQQTPDGETALLSTFSFGGGHYKYMTCPADIPWANCLDHPCLVDKLSPDERRAYCTCDLVRGQTYVTFAGKCNTTNCDKAIWSGATVEGNQQLMAELAKMPDIHVEQAMCSSKIEH